MIGERPAESLKQKSKPLKYPSPTAVTGVKKMKAYPNCNIDEMADVVYDILDKDKTNQLDFKVSRRVTRIHLRIKGLKSAGHIDLVKVEFLPGGGHSRLECCQQEQGH